jgi:AMMECR1 domain-containing protein
VIMPDRRGELDQQQEIHGRSPSFRIEIYSDDDEECSAIQEEIFQLFRHAKNVSKSATDSAHDTHTVTFVKINSYGGTQEPMRGDMGYWVTDYYTFYYKEAQ